jgi:hypothetical protein
VFNFEDGTLASQDEQVVTFLQGGRNKPAETGSRGIPLNGEFIARYSAKGLGSLDVPELPQ